MKKLIPVGIVILSLGSIVALYFALRPRTTWWKDQDDVYTYKLISDGPWIGEGYFVNLEVTGIKSGNILYVRRLLTGLDTNGIPGFRSARLDRPNDSVIITVEHIGVREIVIPILGKERSWQDFQSR